MIITVREIVRENRVIKVLIRLFPLHCKVKPSVHSFYAVILENNSIESARKSHQSNPVALDKERPHRAEGFPAEALSARSFVRRVRHPARLRFRHRICFAPRGFRFFFTEEEP